MGGAVPVTTGCWWYGSRSLAWLYQCRYSGFGFVLWFLWDADVGTQNYFWQLHVTQQWSQNKRIKINRSLTSYFISARLVGKERWWGNTNRDVNRMVIPRCRLNKTISVWNWKNGGPRKVNFSIESLSEITLPWLFLSSQSEIVKIKRVSIIVLLNFLVFKSLALLKYNWLAILKNFLCCGSY